MGTYENIISFLLGLTIVGVGIYLLITTGILWSFLFVILGLALIGVLILMMRVNGTKEFKELDYSKYISEIYNDEDD